MEKKSEIDLEDIVSCGTDFLILTELEWSFNVIVIVMDIVHGVNGPQNWESLMAEFVTFGWTIPLINRQIALLLQYAWGFHLWVSYSFKTLYLLN